MHHGHKPTQSPHCTTDRGSNSSLTGVKWLHLPAQAVFAITLSLTVALSSVPSALAGEGDRKGIVLGGGVGPSIVMGGHTNGTALDLRMGYAPRDDVVVFLVRKRYMGQTDRLPSDQCKLSGLGIAYYLGFLDVSLFFTGGIANSKWWRDGVPRGPNWTGIGLFSSVGVEGGHMGIELGLYDITRTHDAVFSGDRDLEGRVLLMLNMHIVVY